MFVPNMDYVVIDHPKDGVLEWEKGGNNVVMIDIHTSYDSPLVTIRIKMADHSHLTVLHRGDFTAMKTVKPL